MSGEEWGLVLRVSVDRKDYKRKEKIGTFKGHRVHQKVFSNWCSEAITLPRARI
jgi:hypothetical protein